MARITKPPSPNRLSTRLRELAGLSRERAVTLGVMIQHLGTSALLTLAILLGLPFILPLPLVGVSIPFGALIALIGLGLLLGRPPWIPARLLNWPLPPGFFGALLNGSAGLIATLERLVRPRFPAFFSLPFSRPVIGAVVMFCGLLLMLPLPIPFANFFPAATLLLTGVAWIERDGILLGAAAGMLLLTLGFFTLLGLGGNELWEAVKRLWEGHAAPS